MRLFEIVMLVVCMLGITLSVYLSVSAHSEGSTLFCVIFAAHTVVFAILLTIVVCTTPPKVKQ